VKYTIILTFPLQSTAFFLDFVWITNLRNKYLYSYNITIFYMFRALLCSSSGGQIVYIQHLVPSLSVSGRTLHYLRADSDAVYTGCPGRNVPDFGRMFLKLKYTDITQNTYIQS